MARCRLIAGTLAMLQLLQVVAGGGDGGAVPVNPALPRHPRAMRRVQEAALAWVDNAKERRGKRVAMLLGEGRRRAWKGNAGPLVSAGSRSYRSTKTGMHPCRMAK